MAPGAKQRKRARAKKEAEAAAASGDAPDRTGADSQVPAAAAPPPPTPTPSVPDSEADGKMASGKLSHKARRQAARERHQAARAAAAAVLADIPEGEANSPIQDEEDIPPMPPKAKGEKGWKAVHLGGLLSEFTGSGGVMFEEADDDFAVTYLDPSSKPSFEPKPKKKSKTKTKEQTKLDDSASDDDDEGESGAPPVPPAPQDQEEWPAWMPFDLHPTLMKGLRTLGFKTPTHVQARCLIPAVRQRKDIVGAAETGSGKTLAFGLPILHHILSALDKEGVPTDITDKPEARIILREDGPQALIILPTRELAVQVQSHINAVAVHSPVRSECVVGGISVEKQKRRLKRKPYIVVGTPGRLHALMGLAKNNQQECFPWLRDTIGDLRHLILDEADRLVESGHFRELDGILSHIYTAVERTTQLQTFVFSATLTLDPRTDYHKSKTDGGKVGALMKRLRFRETRAVHTVDLTQAEPAPKPIAGAEGEANDAPEASEDTPDGEDAKKDKAASRVAQEAAKVAEAAGAAGLKRLPERLQLFEAICSNDKDKEATLALYLLRRYRWDAPEGTASLKLSSSDKQEAEKALKKQVGGRVVLFVNAITSVHRLSRVLALLLESPNSSNILSRVKMGAKQSKASGLVVDTIGLHSKMKQGERMKRMERFRKLDHAVLVCTDIAARGLDVPEVAAVIHFQVPRNAETFIHRSGRTARAGRDGESIALVSPADGMRWSKLYRGIDLPRSTIQALDVSANQMNAAKEAVRLAIDLEKKVHKEYRVSGDRTWLKRTADEAELEISEDERDDDQGRAPPARRQLGGLYQQLLQRVRRAPKRDGGGPLKVKHMPKRIR